MESTGEIPPGQALLHELLYAHTLAAAPIAPTDALSLDGKHRAECYGLKDDLMAKVA